MGMPCEVNSILKLKPAQGYPEPLEVGSRHQACKEGYRIIPIDIPISLVDENWVAHADIVIYKLSWEKNKTTIAFKIERVYKSPFITKE